MEARPDKKVKSSHQRNRRSRSPWRTLYDLDVTEDELLSGNWELEIAGYVPDNRFKRASQFYPPISARLGARFSY